MELPLTQNQPLASVFRKLGRGSFPPIVESFERGKTIFFPGDPAERVYFLSEKRSLLSCCSLYPCGTLVCTN